MSSDLALTAAHFVAGTNKVKIENVLLELLAKTCLWFEMCH